MTHEVRPEDFTLKYNDEFEVYPFFEDEDGYITGYGHQDRDVFASEIVRYDRETGEQYETTVEEYLPHVRWRWAAFDTTGEYLMPAPYQVEGTFPITTLWRYR